MIYFINSLKALPSIYSKIIFWVSFSLFTFSLLYILLGTGEPNSSNRILRFLILPLLIVITSLVFCRKLSISIIRIERKFGAHYLLGFLIVTHVLILFTLKFLKLSNNNYEYYDAGLYLSKISFLKDISTSDQFTYLLTNGHFQPLLIFMSGLLNISGAYSSVFLFQTMMISLGAIPVYLLARNKLRSEANALIIASTFLFYPALQFADILGFHPDHLQLVGLLWAFYFAEQKKFIYSSLSLMLFLFAGELLFPTALAFSVYIAIRFKSNLFAASISLIFISVFIVILYLKSNFNQFTLNSEVTTQYTIASSYFWIFNNSSIEMIETLISGHRYVFILFLFLPFISIKLICWPVAIVMLPDLCKTLLSDDIFHHSIEGHYSYAITAVIFVTFICSLNQLDRSNRIYVSAASLIISIGLGVVHSPMPYSIDFYTNFSGATFNYRQYVSSRKSAQLESIKSELSQNGQNNLAVSNGSFSTIFLDENPINIFPGTSWKDSSSVLIYKGDLTKLAMGKGTISKDDLLEFEEQIKSLKSNFKLSIENKDFKLWKKNDL